MSDKKRPFRTLVIKVVDALKAGVPLRNSYHYFKYAADRRSVAKNRRFRKAQKAGGLAFPPPRLIYRVAAHHDQEQFDRSGRWAADFIKNVLSKNGRTLEDIPAILDFGCGCGRIFRHWRDLAGPQLYGCDYQRPLVRWCRTKLGFGQFERNGLLSALSYPDRTFGLIYAISVFTHLDRQGQLFWIGELERVLEDRGYLFITVHGTTRLAELSAEEQRLFNAGQPIIHRARYSGANVCATYHPRKYIEDVLVRRLKLVEFLPGGARDANQDAYLFQKG